MRRARLVRRLVALAPFPAAVLAAAAMAAFFAPPAAAQADGSPAPARVASAAERGGEPAVNPRTWVDHDGRPIVKPEERGKNLYAHELREAITEPLGRAFDVPDKILSFLDGLGLVNDKEAENVNVFDEVPNSTWFTNRNHVRSMRPEELTAGPGGERVFPAEGWTIKAAKRAGVTPGFTIKDSADKRWIVKLDAPGYPQLTSGTDAIVSRLLFAAGYNVPYDVPVTFRREDLMIDEELARGEGDDPPFTEADLETLLAHGHREADGRYYGQASLYLDGTPIGHIDMRGRRPDDPNDSFRHPHRRELRGLYTISAWLGSWDTKDHQSLDAFRETADTLGHVQHYLVDFGGALGASANGPKEAQYGFEYTVDWEWIARRLVTFGFAIEPWRRARQESGIPSVGNFQSEVFHPDDHRSLQPHPAFIEHTAADGYWGAKIVASFSDGQIAAAIDAAGFEDPRAKPYLLDALTERRDKVARFWFERVAPLDFFHVDGGLLRFRDLAVDRRLEAPRAYEARILLENGERRDMTITLPAAEIAFGTFGEATLATIRLRPVGSGAMPAVVELMREGAAWRIARVRHG